MKKVTVLVTSLILGFIIMGCVTSSDKGIAKYSYEDNIVKISMVPLTTEIGFSLQNKSQNSIKIIWDEALYISEEGISCKIMHSGVKYIDKDGKQTPTVVAKGTIINDVIVPTDTQKDWDNYTQRYVGKAIRVLLPLQIEGVANEYTLYTFSFSGEGYVEKK